MDTMDFPLVSNTTIKPTYVPILIVFDTPRIMVLKF